MFKRITCPTCSYKFSVPEAAMQKRHVCPNCQSPFLAGKSSPEPEIAMSQQAAIGAAAAGAGGGGGLNKTMMADAAAPAIKFNCPRCKTAQEAAVNEAGTKRPCSSCGQRLQVPPAPAPAPGLDKTMLATDANGAQGAGGAAGRHAHIAGGPAPDPTLAKTMLVDSKPPIRFDCPRCQKTVEVPAGEAGTKRPCPNCSQRLQVPMESTKKGIDKTMLVSDRPGAIAAGAAPVGANAAPAGPTMPGTPQTTPAAPFQLPVSPKVLIIAGIAGGVVLLLLLLLMLMPSSHDAAVAKAKKDLEEIRQLIEKTKMEQEALKEKARRDEEMKKAIEDRKQEIMLLFKKTANNSNNIASQITENQVKYRKLDDIVNDDLRLQAKARLDAEQTKLRRQEAEEKKLLADIEDQKRRAAADERRLAQEERDRIQHNRMLQLQMQQQNAAMNAAMINASRPSYSPWHPGRYWPW